MFAAMIWKILGWNLSLIISLPEGVFSFSKSNFLIICCLFNALLLILQADSHLELLAFGSFA